MKPAISFPEAHPYWSGLVLGAVTIPVFLVLPEPLAQQWAALLLAMIGGAYVGFAARDGRPGATHIELAGGLLFAGIGLAGLHFNPLDRGRLCRARVLGSCSSSSWSVRDHAALVHSLLRRL